METNYNMKFNKTCKDIVLDIKEREQHKRIQIEEGV